MTAIIVLRKQPDGKTDDLADPATTMWYEVKMECPNNPDHGIVGCTRKVMCYQCKVWWWRDGYGGK